MAGSGSVRRNGAAEWARYAFMFPVRCLLRPVAFIPLPLPSFVNFKFEFVAIPSSFGVKEDAGFFISVE